MNYVENTAFALVTIGFVALFYLERTRNPQDLNPAKPITKAVSAYILAFGLILGGGNLISTWTVSANIAAILCFLTFAVAGLIVCYGSLDWYTDRRQQTDLKSNIHRDH